MLDLSVTLTTWALLRFIVWHNWWPNCYRKRKTRMRLVRLSLNCLDVVNGFYQSCPLRLQFCREFWDLNIYRRKRINQGDVFWISYYSKPYRCLPKFGHNRFVKKTMSAFHQIAEFVAKGKSRISRLEKTLLLTELHYNLLNAANRSDVLKNEPQIWFHTGLTMKCHGRFLRCICAIQII